MAITESNMSECYRLFFGEHLPPSWIDRRLDLPPGTTRRAIAASWLDETCYKHINRYGKKRKD